MDNGPKHGPYVDEAADAAVAQLARQLANELRPAFEQMLTERLTRAIQAQCAANVIQTRLESLPSRADLDALRQEHTALHTRLSASVSTLKNWAELRASVVAEMRQVVASEADRLRDSASENAATQQNALGHVADAIDRLTTETVDARSQLSRLEAALQGIEARSRDAPTTTELKAQVQELVTAQRGAAHAIGLRLGPLEHSAKTLETLLSDANAPLLSAVLRGTKADETNARFAGIEASLEKQRAPLLTVQGQQGTLHELQDAAQKSAGVLIELRETLHQTTGALTRLEQANATLSHEVAELRASIHKPTWMDRIRSWLGGDTARQLGPGAGAASDSSTSLRADDQGQGR